MSCEDGGWRSTRGTCREPVFGVDLNVVPPCESRVQERISKSDRSQDRQTSQEVGATEAEPIDVEAFDDDVIISSARAFAVAKNNPRNKRRLSVVVDLESEEWSSRRNKRRRPPAEQTIANCDLYISVESNGNSTRKQSATESPPPPLPPKEPTLSCPICTGPFVETVSTKCGHIFCKACINTAIAAKSRCPMCRRTITLKDIIRIYLPTTNSS